MWMNSYEIRNIADRFDAETQPNAERGARILLNLHTWTNNNSDGWAYWRKPSNAAERLMLELDRVKNPRGFSDAVDLTAAELASAIRPIRAFFTRQINAGNATDQDREWVTDPDTAARKAAEAHAAAVAAKEEALHVEAADFATRFVAGADPRATTEALVCAAYLAGAKR